MNRKRVIPYPEERALEDAYAREMTPTRLFPLLLPIWCVEVKATITEGEPYELIDHFLERGIAEGGLDSVPDLARFFSLDETLVDRALRALTGIGHLSMAPNGRLALTEIGTRSVREGVRYVVKRQDRRKLYFDAFGSRPLPRVYYDPSTVTLLSGAELVDVVERRDGPSFRMLVSQNMFRDEALAGLATLADRDRFNLPERVDAPERVSPPEPVHLPMYLVRAVTRSGRAHLLAYTQAGDSADSDITEICERTPEIVGVVENEEGLAKDGRDEKRTQEWLRKRGLEGLHPVRLQNGMLRVSFPDSCFHATDREGVLSLSKLGSFVVLGNDFFQVWCTDEPTRRRALLARVDAYLSARRRIRRPDFCAWIDRIGRQVGLGQVGIAELHRMAAKAGKHDLAIQLDQISAQS